MNIIYVFINVIIINFSIIIDHYDYIILMIIRE